MKRAAIICISVAALSLDACSSRPSSPTPSSDDISQGIAAHEQITYEQITYEWDDEELIGKYRRGGTIEADIRWLYTEFLSTVVSPPDPDSDKYSIDNGEVELKNTRRLGKDIHNRLQSLQDEQKAYEYLLIAMRDTLLLDSMHIPMAIRGNRSRDVYWFELHRAGMNATMNEYARLFPAHN